MSDTMQKNVDFVSAENAKLEKPLKRLHADSMTTRLLALEVGESASWSRRIPGEEAIASVVQETILRFHRNTSSKIKRLRDRDTSRTYTSATGEYRSREGDLIVSICVTRKS